MRSDTSNFTVQFTSTIQLNDIKIEVYINNTEIRSRYLISAMQASNASSTLSGSISWKLLKDEDSEVSDELIILLIQFPNRFPIFSV